MIKLLLCTSYDLMDLPCVQKGAIGEEHISSKEVEMRALLVALSGAKVLGIRRGRVLCDAMGAIQVINGSKYWVLISIVADIFLVVDFDKMYFCHIPGRLHEMAHPIAKLYQSFNCGLSARSIT